jgi:hypothetical protein
MKRISQIVVPSSDLRIDDLAEDLTFSLQGLQRLIGIFEGNATSTGAVSHLYAVQDYLDYLIAIAETLRSALHEYCVAERKGASRH